MPKAVSGQISARTRKAVPLTQGSRNLRPSPRIQIHRPCLLFKGTVMPEEALSTVTLQVTVSFILTTKPRHSRPRGFLGRLRDRARRILTSGNDAAATGLMGTPVAQLFSSLQPAASPLLVPPPYYVTPPRPSNDNFWDPTWYEVRTAVASRSSVSTDNSPRVSDVSMVKVERGCETQGELVSCPQASQSSLTELWRSQRAGVEFAFEWREDRIGFACLLEGCPRGAWT